MARWSHPAASRGSVKACSVAELLVGSQEPTHRVVAPYEHTYGPQAVALAEMAGLTLDPWQAQMLHDGLGYVDGLDAAGRPAERWSSFEVGVELSRQNGKSVVFEARVLAGLYLLREQLIVYSAHETETAKKAFERIQALIESDGELLAEVKNDGRNKGFRRTNGQLSITLWTGQVVMFRTRTGGGGRGLSGDCVILDEAQDLNDDHVAALMPVLSARPNPQLWYGGSAGTRKSTVQGRLVRRAALTPPPPRFTYWRWAMGEHDDPSAPATWARLNPSYGRRLHPDTVAAEYGAMTLEKFGHERLGVGDYPREEGEDWVYARRHWERCEDVDSKISGPVVFSLEVSWNRERASISVAGRRKDGAKHVGTITNAPGTRWSVDELARLTRSHDNLGVVIDPYSPANSLVGPLQDRGVKVHLLKSEDTTKAFGLMYDEVMDVDLELEQGTRPRLFHTGGTLLTSHLAEATTRDVRGATTWRRAGSKDTTGIISACWAGYGVDLLDEPTAPTPAPELVESSAGITGGGFDAATMGF